MRANAWLHEFHELVRKKAESLAQCELEKGELEAALLLIGSNVITLFPQDIGDGEQVPSVVIRLLEELSHRRNEDGKLSDVQGPPGRDPRIQDREPHRDVPGVHRTKAAEPGGDGSEDARLSGEGRSG